MAQARGRGMPDIFQARDRGPTTGVYKAVHGSEVDLFVFGGASEQAEVHDARRLGETPAVSCCQSVPLENLEMSETGRIYFLHNSPPMLILLTTFFAALSSIFRSRAVLQ